MSVFGPALLGERTFRPLAFAGSLGLVQPAAQRVFQRAARTGGLFGQGQAAVSLSLAPTQAISTLDYQVRDAANPTNVLAAWTQANTQTLSANAVTAVSLTVPARLGWLLVDIRANGEYGSIVTTPPIGVGEVIAAAGQSLASDFWGTVESGDTTTLASLGVAASANSSCLAAWDGATLPTSATGWTTPADGSVIPSAFAAEFLRLAVAASGVNCALVGYAYTGTYLGQWVPGAAAYSGVQLYNAFTSSLTLAGGAFGTLIWCQGHNDARLSGGNGQDTPAATYTTQLGTLMAALASAYPAPSFRRLIGSIGGITSAAGSKYDANWINTVRGASIAYVGSDPLATEVDMLDAVLVADGVHPTQAGNVTLARHYARAFRKAIGVDATGDAGPNFSGTATRTAGSANIVIPVTQAGGTGLVGVGTPASQFTVFPHGQTSGALTVTSVALAANSVTLTLSAAPANSQALDVSYRLPFDSATALASGIYDNNTADGLPNGRMLMMAGATAPLVVAAPVAQQITLTQPTGTFVAGTGTISVAGTTTSDTGGVNVAVDGGTYASLVASQSGTFSGTIAVPTTAGSHSIVVQLADTPTVTASVTVTVQAPAVPAISLTQPSGTFVAGVGTIAVAGTTANDTGGVNVSLDGGAYVSLVASQGGTYSGTVATPATGGSHTIAVQLADSTSHTASVTINVEQAVTSGVPTTGLQYALVTGGAATLTGLTTGYAVLNTGSADEGTRVPFTSGALPNIAPQASGSYTLRIYDAATNGSLLAASSTITVAAKTVASGPGTAVFAFDASDSRYLFADTARTNAQKTNFGGIQGVIDQSTAGNNLVQLTAAKAPQLIVNRRNGLSGVKFLGSSSQLLTAVSNTWQAALMTSPLTVLAVFEMVSDANSSAPYVPGALAYSSNTTGQNAFDIQASTTGSPFVGGARNPASSFGSAKDTSAGVTVKNTLLKVAATFNPSTNTVITVVNGDSPVTNSGLTGPYTQSGSLWDTFDLGGQPATTPFVFDGYLYEYDLWSAAATSAQLQSLVSYATAKWGS